MGVNKRDPHVTPPSEACQKAIVKVYPNTARTQTKANIFSLLYNFQAPGIASTKIGE